MSHSTYKALEGYYDISDKTFLKLSEKAFDYDKLELGTYLYLLNLDKYSGVKHMQLVNLDFLDQYHQHEIYLRVI